MATFRRIVGSVTFSGRPCDAVDFRTHSTTSSCESP
jgi:hypothetical protein